MKINAIVAVSENGVIGVNGGIPWSTIPEDMLRFRELTTGNAIIMGRRTWESLPVKPLPGRKNIIVSKSIYYENPIIDIPFMVDGLTTTVPSLNHALSHAVIATAISGIDLFIIGGERLYREALPLCDEVYLTRVHCQVAIPAGAEAAKFDDDWIFNLDFNCEILGRTEDGMATFYRYYKNKA